MGRHLAARAAAALLVFTTMAGPAMAQAEQDASIYRWNGQQWVQVDGSAARISLAPDGTPWVVTAGGQIYSYANGDFRLMPGTARDIGVGGDGRPWIIGTDSVVQRWTGKGWEPTDGTGVAISVDSAGTPWVVNAQNRIYIRVGNRFILQNGQARDIGAGADVWIVAPDQNIHRLTSGGWTQVPGTALRIAAAQSGTAWVVNQSGTIYRLQADGTSQRMPGQAQDIAATATGEVWMVGRASAAPQPRTGRQRRP